MSRPDDDVWALRHKVLGQALAEWNRAHPWRVVYVPRHTFEDLVSERVDPDEALARDLCGTGIPVGDAGRTFGSVFAESGGIHMGVGENRSNGASGPPRSALDEARDLSERAHELRARLLAERAAHAAAIRDIDAALGETSFAQARDKRPARPGDVKMGRKVNPDSISQRVLAVVRNNPGVLLGDVRAGAGCDSRSAQSRLGIHCRAGLLRREPTPDGFRYYPAETPADDGRNPGSGHVG